MELLALIVVHLSESLFLGSVALESAPLTLRVARSDFWHMLSELSPEEQNAVAAAAHVRLEHLLQPPDEYGYSPRKLVSPHWYSLLEEIASGNYQRLRDDCIRAEIDQAMNDT